jgi:hypothetical protein
MWRELLDWLLGAEKTLDAHQQVGNDPIKIKEGPYNIEHFQL